MSAVAAPFLQSARDSKSDFKYKAHDASELDEERVAQALQRLDKSDPAAACLWREQVKGMVERNKEIQRLLETHRISAQLNVSHMQIAKEEVIERALTQQEATLRVQFENDLKTLRGEAETTQRKAETRFAAAVAKAEANELKLKEEFAAREHELREELFVGKNRERQLERKVGEVERTVKNAQSKFEGEAKLREVLMGETVNMSADLRRQADQAARDAEEARKAAASATEKLDKAMAALRKKEAECEEILASVQQGSADTLDMRASYERKLRELEEAHAEELERRESAHEQELSSCKAAHDKAMEETAELHERAMRERQLACERLVQSRHSAHADTLREKDELLAAAEAAAAAALEAAAAESKAAIEACRAAGQRALDEAVAAHAAEMEQRASLEKGQVETMGERLRMLQTECDAAVQQRDAAVQQRDAAVQQRDALVPRVEELTASVEELSLANSALEEKLQLAREGSKYMALAASVSMSALGAELRAAEEAMDALRERMASQTQQFRKKVQETTGAAGNALRLAEDRAARSRAEVKALTLSLAKADAELQTTLGGFAEANRALLVELEGARAAERKARGAAQRAAEARRQDKLAAEAERRRSEEAAAKMLADAARKDREAMLLRQEMGDEMKQLVRSSRGEVSRCQVEVRLLRLEMQAEAEAEAEALSAELAHVTAEAQADVDRCVADLRALQAESARLRQQLSHAEESRKSLDRVSVELEDARATAAATAASLAEQLRDAMASAKELQALFERKLSMMETRLATMAKRLAGSDDAVEEAESVDAAEIERAGEEMSARFVSAAERLRELVEAIGLRFGRLGSLLGVSDDVNTRALLSSCLAPLGALPAEEKPREGSLSCNGKKLHKSASAVARSDPISTLRQAIDFGTGSVCSKENEPEVASPSWRPHGTPTRLPPPGAAPSPPRPFRDALPRAAAFLTKRTHEMAPKPHRRPCADARPEPLSPLPARRPSESFVRESAALHTVQSAPELESLPQRPVGPGRSPVRRGGGFSAHAAATYCIGSYHEALVPGADIDIGLLEEVETIPKSELQQMPGGQPLALAESPFATRALLPALGASRVTAQRGCRGRGDVAAASSPSRKKAAQTARAQRGAGDKPVRLRTAPDVDVSAAHPSQESRLASTNEFIGLGRTVVRERQQQPPAKAWKAETADILPDAWSAQAASALQEDILVTTM